MVEDAFTGSEYKHVDREDIPPLVVWPPRKIERAMVLWSRARSSSHETKVLDAYKDVIVCLTRRNVPSWEQLVAAHLVRRDDTTRQGARFDALTRCVQNWAAVLDTACVNGDGDCFPFVAWAVDVLANGMVGKQPHAEPPPPHGYLTVHRYLRHLEVFQRIRLAYHQRRWYLPCATLAPEAVYDLDFPCPQNAITEEGHVWLEKYKRDCPRWDHRVEVDTVHSLPALEWVRFAHLYPNNRAVHDLAASLHSESTVYTATTTSTYLLPSLARVNSTCVSLTWMASEAPPRAALKANTYCNVPNPSWTARHISMAVRCSPVANIVHVSCVVDPMGTIRRSIAAHWPAKCCDATR